MCEIKEREVFIMKKKTHNHLTINDREFILNMISNNKSLRSIASALGKTTSAISRELKKHRHWTA